MKNALRPACMVVLLALVAVQAQTQASLAANALRALFLDDNPPAARGHAAAALRLAPGDARALFVEMEAAALEADTSAMLEAALRLCEEAPGDPRAEIAAARLRSHAANTRAFRELLPRIQELVKQGTPEAQTLRLALVAAAADGARGLRLHTLARDAGVLTEWRMLGPFGRHSYADFDRAWGPEGDQLRASEYEGRRVERFSFLDGSLRPPAYFSRAGVFYAAADFRLPSAGVWRLEIETADTLEVFLNGERVLTHDRRYRAGSQVATRDLKLEAGAHRVLVKFVPTAAPWRMAVLPGAGPQPRRSQSGVAAEGDYLAAARRYWLGDYDGAIARLTASSGATPAVSQLLLADAWAGLTPDAPEELDALKAALQSAPSALAAEYRLAQNARARGREDEALERVRRVLLARPDFMPAHALMAEIATGLRWDAAALEARQARLELHPSCDALRDAARFFASSARFDRARDAERRLQGCAPGSLAYAEALGEAGLHQEAAAAAAEVIAEDPLHRGAHALRARQLALAGEDALAREATRRFRELAPNSPAYDELMQSLHATPEGLTGALTDATEFYAAYRRDPFEVMRAAAGPNARNGHAVVLLHERVAQVAPDGSVALYVHILTRALTREGVRRQREVTLPAGAELLELRTLKADGGIAEPEFTPHKATISMTGLGPGDVIQQEYVVRYNGRQGAASEPDALRFTFGSFNAPVVFARFITLTPASGETTDEFETLSWGGAPAHRVQRTGEALVRTWERHDMPHTVRDAKSASAATLPGVRLIPAREWREVRDRYRDLALRATRIGRVVEDAAASLKEGDEDEAALVRQIYQTARQRVGRAFHNFAAGRVDPAERSLQRGEGSRTMVMLALARAAGLRADLVLTRDLDSPEAVGDAARPLPSLRAYTRPLVRMHAGGRHWLLDAEAEGMEFGEIASNLALDDALLVPLENVPSAPMLIALTSPAAGREGQHARAISRPAAPTAAAQPAAYDSVDDVENEDDEP